MEGPAVVLSSLARGAACLSTRSCHLSVSPYGDEKEQLEDTERAESGVGESGEVSFGFVALTASALQAAAEPCSA